jgi:hypothetical protein
VGDGFRPFLVPFHSLTWQVMQVMSSPGTDQRDERTSERGEGGAGKKSRKVVATEQVWRLTCLCGKRLGGPRQDAEQIVVCSHCDRRHFVLPINRYPAPKSRKRKKSSKGKSAGPNLKVVLSTVLGATTAVWKGLRWAFVASLTSLQRKLLAGYRAVLQWFTPLRITLIALVMVVIAGSVLAVRQQRYQQAVRDLRDSVVLAEAAEQAGNWAEATREYARAAAAISVLKREDEFAREILWKHRELQAQDQLCSLSLEEMLTEATGKGRLAGSWENTFRHMVQNRWLVMECWLLPQSTADDEGFVRLVQPLLIQGETVQFRWPLSLLRNYPEGDKGGLHILSAGQVQQLTPPHPEEPHWVITIQPETAFLWMNTNTLSPLGFDLETVWMPDYSLRKIIEIQRKLEAATENSSSVQ